LCEESDEVALSFSSRARFQRLGGDAHVVRVEQLVLGVHARAVDGEDRECPARLPILALEAKQRHAAADGLVGPVGGHRAYIRVSVVRPHRTVDADRLG
jgi:hypothetical protein